VTQTSQTFRLTNLKTEKIGGKLWKLTKPLVFTTDVGFIRVPKGFITDGASAPWMAWSLCPPMSGFHAEAAVLHDYLYSKDSTDTINVSRKAADDYFLAGMLENGTKKWRAKTIHRAVRLGGGGSYKKCYSKEKVMVK